jgi:hypothetical protein
MKKTEVYNLAVQQEIVSSSVCFLFTTARKVIDVINNWAVNINKMVWMYKFTHLEVYLPLSLE